jgi:hypothetical protein
MLQETVHEAGGHHRTTEIAMGKPFITLAITMFVLACGPEVGEEDDMPGELVYEQPPERLYRLDRRIEVIFGYEREDGLEGRCGILTDRAYDELEGTLAALDPSVDYGEHPADCDVYSALVHIEGFDHSPFECSSSCCHRDLYWAAFVYAMILDNFQGGSPTVDGEPYVAIEPDQPCP